MRVFARFDGEGGQERRSREGQREWRPDHQRNISYIDSLSNDDKVDIIFFKDHDI